jgi:hypothetical protein
MGSIFSAIGKYAPIVLKWIVNVGPLVYEGVRWGKKIFKELKNKEKPTNPTKPCSNK